MAENVELDISIAKLKQELAELQKAFGETAVSADSAFGTVGDEVTALTKEMQDLLAVQREVGVDTKKLEGASAGYSTRLKAAIRDTQVFGKSIGEWGDQLKSVVGSLGSATGATGKMAGALRLVGAAIKISGLGLLYGLVISLVAYFRKFESGINKVSQVTAAFSAVVDVVINRFLTLASAIGNFFTGNFTAAANDLSAAFSGVATEIANAAVAAYDLEKAFQQLAEDSRTAGVDLARQAVALAKLKAIADDETRSIATRSAAQKQANALEQRSLETKLDLARRQLEADQKNFFLHKEDAAIRDAAAASEIAYLGLVQDANAAQIQGEQALTALRKQAAEDRKKIRDQEAADEKKRADLRVAVLSDEYEKQIAAEQLRYERLLADLNKYFKGREELLGLIEQAEKQHKTNLAAIFLDQVEDAQKRLDELNKLRAAREEYETEANKKELAAAKKNIAEIEALQNSELDITEQNFKNYIDVLEASGASKEAIAEKQLEFDRLVEAERIRVKIETQEALLKLTSDGDEAQITILKNNILLLKSQLEGLSIDPAKPKSKGGNGLLDLLGIKPEDQKGVEKAVSDAVNAIGLLTQARTEAADAALRSAEAEVQATEDKVDAAKDALDRELEIAATGFASDVTRKREALALAEKEAAEAKAREAKALEDKRKAQRAQILLDSAFQVSNLITASTNVISGFSAIPIFGVPLGIAAVALMVGAFIKSKAAALQAVKAKDGIQGSVGSRGIVVGPSHDNEGVPLEVEGGEFIYQNGKRISVVNKRATAAHFGLLQAINNDDRRGMVGYLERLTGGISRDSVATDQVVSSVGAASGSHRSGGGESLSMLARSNQLAEENTRLTRRLVELEENRTEYVDMGDHILITKKGRQEKVMKRG